MRRRHSPELTSVTPVGAPIETAAAVYATGPARVLRVAEVMARSGLSRTSLWRLERRGAFPARRQLSPGAVGWIEAEVEAWILGRLTRDAVGARGRMTSEGLG